MRILIASTLFLLLLLRAAGQNYQGPQWSSVVEILIPYTIDEDFPEDKISEIYSAMNDYENNTCIRFAPKIDSDPGWVDFQSDNTTTCATAESCQGNGPRNVTIGPNCISAKVTSRELGLVLCLSPEEDRPDRDDYITFANGCTAPKKYAYRDPRIEDIFYDYVSMMHSESSCFIPTLPGVTRVGGGPEKGGPLSVLDAEKINAYYNCEGCFSYRYRPISKITGNENLLAAGYDGNTTLYPCRAYVNGDIVPGKGTTSQCWAPYDHNEYSFTSNYEILTNPQNTNFVWTPTSAGAALPRNVIAGGRAANGEKLYIGRCTLTINGDTTEMAGKLHLSASTSLYVSYGGSEYQCSTFDLLTCSD